MASAAMRCSRRGATFSDTSATGAAGDQAVRNEVSRIANMATARKGRNFIQFSLLKKFGLMHVSPWGNFDG